jgi:ligand-binding sensor domain-containing protein
MPGALRIGVFLTTALLLAARQPLHADSRQIPMADFVQEIWEAKDGSLPHPTVSTVLQTRDGYLWVGTYTGLVRFDGRQFHLPHREGAPELATHIRALAESEDGSLWVATRRSGVYRLKDGKVESYTKTIGLPAGDIRALTVQGGRLWIGAGTSVTSWDLEKKEARRFGRADGLPDTKILVLEVDAAGTLWVAASGSALARWDGQRFVALPIGPTTPAPGDMQSNGLAADPSGALWFASEAGFARVVPQADGPPVVERFVNEPCRSAFATAEGAWAGCAGGLVRVRDGQVRIYGPADGIGQGWLDGVYEDSERSVWVATRTGLLRLRPRFIETYTHRDGGARFGATDCVLETRDGDLWVGSVAGLSRRHDGKWTTYDTRHGLPHTAVRSLAEAPDGALWIGTGLGIARFEGGRVTATYRLRQGSQLMVRAIAMDADGRPWFGTPYGTLHRIENGSMVDVGERRTVCIRGLPNHMRFAGDGTLLHGSEEGLLRMRDGKPLSCEGDPSGLRNDVRHVLEDDRSRLWVGTVGGVSLRDAGGMRVVPGDAGPFDTAVYAILDDQRGAFWFSTPKGVFRVLKTNLEQGLAQGTTPIFRFFGTGDGMESSVCVGTGQPNGWRGRDGRLYFTTTDGIAVVDPARIQVSAAAPPVYVHRLVADSRPVPLEGVARLPPGTRALQIDFAAVDYVAPDAVQYRYRLEGFDRDWVPSGARRTAYYTNLPPGPYRFRVTAANPDGVWNERGAAMAFEIAPYFYQRRSFIALCAMLLVAGATAAYRIRIAHLRATERQLQRRVDDAVAQIKTLRGLLPVCASCKKIRDDSGYWNQMETYIHEHSGVDFSHSVCPDCLEKLYPEYSEHQKKAQGQNPQD